MTKKKAVSYAIRMMRDNFAGFEFDVDEDENGITPDEFEDDIKNGNNICIQGPDEHVCIEMFTREL